jgi:hypothetical protein
MTYLVANSKWYHAQVKGVTDDGYDVQVEDSSVILSVHEFDAVEIDRARPGEKVSCYDRCVWMRSACRCVWLLLVALRVFVRAWICMHAECTARRVRLPLLLIFTCVAYFRSPATRIIGTRRW